MDNLSLIENVHECIPPPATSSHQHTVRGQYQYYHYGCDGFDDRGWGCGYRTLQSLCSWAKYELTKSRAETACVPSIPQIQETLVSIGDKSKQFLGSKNWIGSVEVAMCLDQLYNVSCKIVHVSSGRDLKENTEVLTQHFDTKGAPVMMGGDADSASKGIMGICEADGVTYLLVLDPHYYGSDASASTLMEKGFLLWRPLDSFMDSSFYNMCLPQLAAS